MAGVYQLKVRKLMHTVSSDSGKKGLANGRAFG
jgi:hypothetical protein